MGIGAGAGRRHLSGVTPLLGYKPRVHAVRVFLVVTAAGVALVCPTAAHAFAFKTPGEAAYCGLGFRGDFGCITPNDGFWIRFDGIYRAATNVTVRKGYDRRYRRYHTSLRVLGFGQRWASSDAELVVCVSRATGLTCKHPPSGLTFWLGRNRGYRIYYSTPGYPIRVRPFFRTRTTWCGLLADTLEPANPAIQCWHPATGLIAGVAHDDADGGGVASRSEQAKGHRPRGSAGSVREERSCGAVARSAGGSPTGVPRARDVRSSGAPLRTRV